MTTIDLDTLHLTKGGHETRDDGVCLMEAVAWFRDIEHTDAPACVSPILRSAGIAINDATPDDLRQQLVPFIPLLPGTAGDGKDERRGYMALDWLIRTYLPAWLDLVPVRDGNSQCKTHAESIRQLPEIRDLKSAKLAGPDVRAAGAAARDATGAAAGAAACPAAWAAAGAAARDAAWDAAWAAAGAAARDAARAATGDAAWDAARAAARAATGDAARAAARAATGAAAWDAARDVLAPTVTELQESFIYLYERMMTAA